MWVRQRRGGLSTNNAVNSSDYTPALRKVKVDSLVVQRDLMVWSRPEMGHQKVKSYSGVLPWLLW